MHSTDPPLWHITTLLAQTNALFQLWIVKYLLTDLAQQVNAGQTAVGTFLGDRFNVWTRWFVNWKHKYNSKQHGHIEYLGFKPALNVCMWFNKFNYRRVYYYAATQYSETCVGLIVPMYTTSNTHTQTDSVISALWLCINRRRIEIVLLTHLLIKQVH